MEYLLTHYNPEAENIPVKVNGDGLERTNSHFPKVLP